MASNETSRNRRKPVSEAQRAHESAKPSFPKHYLIREKDGSSRPRLRMSPEETSFIEEAAGEQAIMPWFHMALQDVALRTLVQRAIRALRGTKSELTGVCALHAARGEQGVQAVCLDVAITVNKSHTVVDLCQDCHQSFERMMELTVPNGLLGVPTDLHGLDGIVVDGKAVDGRRR